MNEGASIDIAVVERREIDRPFFPFRNHRVFRRVMRDPETAKEFLERILHLDIDHVEYCNTEQLLDMDIDSKSVCLDLYVKDEARIYNVEIQCQDYADIGKRMLYYQAAMAFDTLDRGRPDFEIPESFIIFLCVDDPFGYDLSRYEFEMTCARADGYVLETGSHWLVLNAQAHEAEQDESVRNLLSYVREERVPKGDSFIERIDGEVRAINRDRKWVEDIMRYMTIEEAAHSNGYSNGYRSGQARGLEEGREEGRAEGEARLSKLVSELLSSKRIDDIERATIDPAYRDRLFEELDIA